MNPLLYIFGSLVCRALGCHLEARWSYDGVVRRPVWSHGEFCGWADKCERCGDERYVGLGR